VSLVLRFGYKASAEQFGPRELVDFAVLADEIGFDTVVISDHFQPWRHNGGHAPFCFAWLAAVGERTQNIQLGTSVVTPTFRYHPAIVAQATGTLGSLFPGRVLLGIGTGESMNEVPLGIEWPEMKERFARLKEATELIKTLWSEDRVTFEGEYYRTNNATIYDRPSESIPLYIAASGQAAARLAGRTADGLICTSGKGMELYRDLLLPAVAEGAAKAARPLTSVDLMIELKVSFDTDRTRALEDTRHWAALALSAEEKVGVHDPIEMERLAEALPLERAASRWIVSDDPADHVDAVMKYVDLGFRHLVFHAPGPDQKRFLRLYAEHVIPSIRERVAVPQ
jgi:coenzyme F420-dependent glucose-6-phosphate dehydrogenase